MRAQRCKRVQYGRRVGRIDGRAAPRGFLLKFFMLLEDNVVRVTGADVFTWDPL
jgi:hypothetical protein